MKVLCGREATLGLHTTRSKPATDALILLAEGGNEGTPVKLKMAENSLFAILLRSPWWISFGIAAGLAVVVVATLPPAWTYYALFVAAPFVVIGIIAASRQLRAPSAARVEQTLAAIREMSWNEFAAGVEAALRAEGYEVTRVDRGETDFEARKASRRTLVGCKRFKVARTGIKPLQD